MGLPVLIIGKSGSGKSASMRNFSENIGIINVLGKPLPFKNSLPCTMTDDYANIKKILFSSTAESVVIDDAGYLMTNAFMRGHSQAGAGNAIFAFYSDIGDQFWGLIRFIVDKLPPDKIVYFIMHEDKNDFGDVKPKTIGKMLDEKVCVEGMFTIVLRSMFSDSKHIFKTQSDGLDIAKTPMDMFPAEIENDLKMVDDTIRDYYNMGGKK
jgi:adenylate kinase family enzyme